VIKRIAVASLLLAISPSIANLRAAESVDHATALPGAGRYDRFQSVKAAQAQRDNELKGVLTQDQWKKYKKLKDELKDQVSAMAELKKKQE